MNIALVEQCFSEDFGITDGRLWIRKALGSFTDLAWIG